MLPVILTAGAWICFVLGASVNFQAWRISLKAKEGESVPSGIPFVPGVAGVFAVFVTLPKLAQWGLSVPWPLAWVALPLFLDVYCLGGLVLSLFGFVRKKDHQ